MPPPAPLGYQNIQRGLVPHPCSSQRPPLLKLPGCSATAVIFTASLRLHRVEDASGAPAVLQWSRSTMCCLTPMRRADGKSWEFCGCRGVLCSVCPGPAPDPSAVGGNTSPPSSVGFGSAPGLLLRPSPGSAPIEAGEIIPWHNRARCQEDFNDIQPAFSTSSDHPIIPTYGSLSPFSRAPILTPLPERALPWLG